VARDRRTHNTTHCSTRISRLVRVQTGPWKRARKAVSFYRTFQSSAPRNPFSSIPNERGCTAQLCSSVFDHACSIKVHSLFHFRTTPAPARMSLSTRRMFSVRTSTYAIHAWSNHRVADGERLCASRVEIISDKLGASSSIGALCASQRKRCS